MDFKANLDDLATICKKIDNNNSNLLQEISKSSKIIDEIPYAWTDNGTKEFMEKYDATLKKLQTLSKAYTSITTETKNCINKYEMLDVEFANKIRRKDLGELYINPIDHNIDGYIAFDQDGQVVYSNSDNKQIQANSKFVNINKTLQEIKKENGEEVLFNEEGVRINGK